VVHDACRIDELHALALLLGSSALSRCMAEEREAWFTPEDYARYSVEARLSRVPARIRPVAHATPADAHLPLSPPHMPGLLQPAMPTMDPAAMIAAAVAPYIAAQFGQQLLPQPPMAWPYGPTGGTWPPALFAPSPMMQSPQPQVAVPVHSDCRSHEPAAASTALAPATPGGAPPRAAPDATLCVSWHGEAAQGEAAGGRRGGTAPSGAAEPGNELWASDEEDDAPTAAGGGLCGGSKAAARETHGSPGRLRLGLAEEEDEVMDEGEMGQEMGQEMGTHEDCQEAANDGFEGQEGAPGQEVEEVEEEVEEEATQGPAAAATEAQAQAQVAEAEESRREARGAAGAVLRGRYEQIDASRKRKQCVLSRALPLNARRTCTAHAMHVPCPCHARVMLMPCTCQMCARALRG
jgi:hypothetical protein